MQQGEEKLHRLQKKLEAISLASTAFACFIFVSVWLIFMPTLPSYVSLSFVILSFLLWLLVVKPSISKISSQKSGKKAD
jgi:Flp pilus assembly protein TadB